MNVKLLIPYALAFLAALSSSAAINAEEERIYQIEVIIFERAPQTGIVDAENWPKNIDLSYPDNREELVDPSSIQAIETSDNSTTNGISLPTAFINSLVFEGEAEGEDHYTESSTPAGAQAIADSSLAAPGTEDTPSNVPSPNTPTLLTYLDKSEHKLTSQHRALDRTRGLRTLFHHAWIQSLTKPHQAPSLVMKGGNLFGEHHELEGSIRISVNRYLHIETDLWLTSFTPNYGQQSEHWPNLPSHEKQYFWSEAEGHSKPHGQNHGFKPSYDLSFSNQSPHNFNTDYTKNTSGQTRPLGYTEQLEARYLIKEIVTLRQKRKMKSKELHYIDHPRMGLLIKITPFTPPQIGANTPEVN